MPGSRPAAVIGLVAALLLLLPACGRRDALPDEPIAPPEPSASPEVSQKKLKEIAAALDGYIQVGNGLPAGLLGPDAKAPGLSWRVQLLRVLGHRELYDAFEMTEPWDSPHNRKLIDRMPAVYARPDGKGPPGYTHYRGLVGPQGALEPRGRHPADPPRPEPGHALYSLPLPAGAPDGTSHTLLVVEAEEAVVWTRPDELPVGPGHPVPKLGGVARGGANVLFCDGSVYFLPADTPADTVKALCTASGGETVELPGRVLPK
ncbi:MAG: hypothetical protein C0501_12935 [Isosphaera sp.]|nr:hypothetical protein [Isosphaera sp.]